MTAIVTHGDARSLPFPDDSIDLIVTSPPYFGLRSYTDGGAHYETQIGAEATPTEFVAALIACTAEMARVLKPTGSIFVNLGDKYAGGGGGNYGEDRKRGAAKDDGAHPTNVYNRPAWLEAAGMRAKSLMLLPERYRIACTDELGLIARAVIVWSKPNGLPESVRDRVRRSHEDWVHLTKSPRYFESVDEIREPVSPAGLERRKYAYAVNDAQRAGKNPVLNGEGMRPANPLGKLPGSVWSIATQPLRVPAKLNVDHFAAFPMEWPRRLITGWCPREVCTACGEGRRPVVDRDRQPTQRTHNGRGFSSPDHGPGTTKGPSRNSLPHRTTVTITGYACACPDTSAPSTPGVVLDPFGGTGTTALVADVLGRVGISLDASADYGRIAEWRTQDPKQRERAAMVKPSAELPLVGPDPELDPFDVALEAIHAATSPADLAAAQLAAGPAWAAEHDALAALRHLELEGRGIAS